MNRMKNDVLSLSMIVLVLVCSSSNNINNLVEGFQLQTKTSSSTSTIITENHQHYHAIQQQQQQQPKKQQHRLSLVVLEAAASDSNSDRDSDSDSTDDNKIKSEGMLFEESSTAAAQGAQFGEVVSIRKKPESTTASSSSPAQFGEVVSISNKPIATATTNTEGTANEDSLFDDYVTTTTTTTTTTTATTTSSTSTVEEIDPIELAASMKRKNIVAAVLSIVLAIGQYIYQLSNPITPIQLLVAMEQTSSPINVIGTNNKPTIIDFWAPWCENCKVSATTMAYIENKYANDINFISVNADTPEAYGLIETFGVDTIPHIALIDSTGFVDTALIGPIPKRILEDDINVMINNSKNIINNKKICADTEQATTMIKPTTVVTQQQPKVKLPYDIVLEKEEEVEQQVVESSTDRSSQNICKEQLPHVMYDAFEFRPDQRRVQF